MAKTKLAIDGTSVALFGFPPTDANQRPSGRFHCIFLNCKFSIEMSQQCYLLKSNPRKKSSRVSGRNWQRRQILGSSHDSSNAHHDPSELERALGRVLLQIERTSMRARSTLAMLARQSRDDVHKMKTRLQAMTLIADHNLLDVYRTIKDCITTLLNDTREISCGAIQRKDLVFSLAFLFHCASRVDLFELSDFSNFFQRKRGRIMAKRVTDEFTTDSDEMIAISRISKPIEESLIDRYLMEIFLPSPEKRPQASGGPSETAGGVLASSQTDRVATKSQNPEIESMDARIPQNQEAGSMDGLSITQFSPKHPIRIFRPNPRLEIAFDLRTRNPVYALEKLLPGQDLKIGNKERTTKTRPRFFEEPTLPEIYRHQLSSFLGNSYDRGHMAPAADFGPCDMKHTFNMCNVSPQERSMNRSIWVKLEHWCRRVANSQSASGVDSKGRKGQDLARTYVITGPCWLPKHVSSARRHNIEYPTIGPMKTMIHVPTHFFKVVIVVDNPNSQCINKFACFLLPNETFQKSTKSQAGKPEKLIDYVVHWDYLEAASGLRFFPTLTGENWSEKARSSTSKVLASRKKNKHGAPERQQRISQAPNADSYPEHLLWVSNEPQNSIDIS